MKLLLFSDVHANMEWIRHLQGRASDADILVGAGDYACFHGRLNKTLEPLLELRKPMVLVAGNNERTEALSELQAMFPFVYVLEGTQVTLEGLTFFGMGAAVPRTPFGPWSFDRTEAEGAALLSACPERCVLVTHAPPKGTLDQNSRNHPLGSQAVRDIVVRRHPLLSVCGHIHAQGGNRALLERTWVVNAGPQGVLCSLEPDQTASCTFLA